MISFTMHAIFVTLIVTSHHTNISTHHLTGQTSSGSSMIKLFQNTVKTQLLTHYFTRTNIHSTPHNKEETKKSHNITINNVKSKFCYKISVFTVVDAMHGT